MAWSPQQEKALDAVGRWLRAGEPQVFRLFGFAGTGKTTLARHLAEGAGEVLFAAYTGKAASVMRRAGCAGASTIHSLIYVPVDKSGLHLHELEERRARYEGREHEHLLEIERLDREIAEEKRRLRRPAFELNEESKLRYASLLIVDECSMVGDDMGRDVLSFGTPVLVLGDPAQLPPVRGTGFFTAHRPDVMLTEIHRQARGNPIIGMATDIREGRGIRVGSSNGCRVVPCRGFDAEAIVPDTQVIVGRNATRRRANARRRATLGFSGETPRDGDRLVCLRNNHDLGLMNGSVWEVVGEPREYPNGPIRMTVREEGHLDPGVDVVAHRQPFLGEDVPFYERRDAEEFDFGYALTAHKAQGSQWPEVLVVDESRVFRNDARRWLYTAVTRASERLTVVL